MKIILLICVFSLVSCKFSDKHELKSIDQKVSYDQLLIYYLYTEAKCNSWNKNIIKSEFCLESYPTKIKDKKAYRFEFIYLSHDVDDDEHFKSSDEKTRLKILKEDIKYLGAVWTSFIQTQGMFSSEINEEILDNMIINVKFNYLDNLSYFYYIGTWNSKSEKINITKKDKEVLAI